MFLIVNKMLFNFIGKIIFLSLFFLLSCKKDQEDTEKIFANPGYTIGVVTEFTNSAYRLTASCHYKYSVNKSEYSGYVDPTIYKIPDSGPWTGDQYIVIYDLSDPILSRMLFNYPIKDSTDYNNYIDQFKTNPPNP